MKVERPDDLIHLTYFMIDWKDVDQSTSEQKCVQCGRPMSRLEAEVGDEDVRYEGHVCHLCKRVVWLKQG